MGLKSLFNKAEYDTHEILNDAAQRHGAHVFAKVRVADVVKLENSGIANDLFDYGLKSHFDFVIYDEKYMPLVAVEYDGATHDTDTRTRINDERKNAICERFNLPLARVRYFHVYEKARNINILSWIAELFFASRAIDKAYEQGHVPMDVDLDPLMFVWWGNLPGTFPLFISAERRIHLQKHFERNVITKAVPMTLEGIDSAGNGVCLVAVTTATEEVLCWSSSIYLHGFGIPPFEAAEEIAVVSLGQIVDEYASQRAIAMSREQFRDRLIRFLRLNKPRMGGGSICGADFGFSITLSGGTGKGKEYRIGELGNLPAEVIRVP